MSLLAEVEQEVANSKVFNLQQLINEYGTACKTIAQGFKQLIDAQNKQMAEALSHMDSAPGEMSALDAALPPALEPYPDPVPATPGAPPSDTDHLGCPQGECLGFPSLPSMKFPFGLPPNPSAEIKAAFDEYTLKFKKMQDKFKTVGGNDLEEKTLNLKKKMMGIPYKLPDSTGPNGEKVPGGLSLPKFNPHSMLHSMGEGIKSKIKTLVDKKKRLGMIGMIDCLKVKDPRYAICEEILRFEAMAKRLTFGDDGLPNVSFGPAGDKIAGFASNMTDLNKLSSLSGAMKQSGSGATADLPTSDPMAAFKNPF